MPSSPNSPSSPYSTPTAISELTSGFSFTNSGFPVEGNATITLKVETAQNPETSVSLSQTIPGFRGVGSAMFTMDKIKKACGVTDLAGSKLEVRQW